MFPVWVAATLTTPPITALAASYPTSIPAPWSACFREAGRFYRLPPTLLVAVAQTESRLNPAAINVDRDGSRDVGLMQINSRWFSALQASGIAPERLYEPCVSIWVGAWLLSDAVAAHGYGWVAIGAYNAGGGRTPAAAERRAAYARRVSRNLAELPPAAGLLDAVSAGHSHIAEFVVAAPAADDAVGNQPRTR
jgi:soluble lytic murein transglycosylase-like protein